MWRSNQSHITACLLILTVDCFTLMTNLIKRTLSWLKMRNERKMEWTLHFIASSLILFFLIINEFWHSSPSISLLLLLFSLDTDVHLRLINEQMCSEKRCYLFFLFFVWWSDRTILIQLFHSNKEQLQGNSTSNRWKTAAMRTKKNPRWIINLMAFVFHGNDQGISRVEQPMIWHRER